MSEVLVRLGRDERSPESISSCTDRSGRVAIALSQGMTEKPNEDAVAVAAAGSSAVLVLADGHWGRWASELGVERMTEAAAAIDAAAAADRPALFRRLYEAVNQTLFDAAADAYNADPQSGGDPLMTPETTLLTCRVDLRTGAVDWASFGDSFLFARTADGLRLLNELRPCWLGVRIHGKVADALQIGRLELAAGDSLLLASDGLVEPVAGGKQVLPDEIDGVVTSELPLEGKVRALVSMALTRGGEDNVACALYA